MTRDEVQSRDIALEELTQLQAIISRHEDHAFKIRGYLYAILGALTAALFIEKPRLTEAGYGGICGVAILLFMSMELIHRCYAGRAMERAGQVEQSLRGERDYDGPRIGASLNLRGAAWAKQVQTECSYPTLPLHYALLTFVVALIVIIRN